MVRNLRLRGDFAYRVERARNQYQVVFAGDPAGAGDGVGDGVDDFDAGAESYLGKSFG